MSHRKLIPIVEGHGEASCVRELVRRYLRQREVFDVLVESPINTKGASKLKATYSRQKRLGVEYWVKMAHGKRPDGILVLLDADKECLDRTRERRPGLGPELAGRARKAAGKIPVEVVVANRQYEAWLVAGWDTIRNEVLLANPDAITSENMRTAEAAHGWVGKLGQALGRGYKKTTDQRSLSGYLPFHGEILANAPSFARFLRCVDRLVEAMRGE